MFQRFIESLDIKDKSSAEDYDLDALFALSGSELSKAENIILDRLKNTNDYRAPRAIAYLNLISAIPLLRECQSTKKGRMLVEITKTLWEFTKDQGLLGNYKKVLEEDPDPYARQYSLRYLEETNGDLANEEYLFQLLAKENDSLVRATIVSIVLNKVGYKKWLGEDFSIDDTIFENSLITGYPGFYENALNRWPKIK